MRIGDLVRVRWLVGTLLIAAAALFAVGVATEGDVLVVPDLVPPKLVIVDDSGHSGDARLATMKRLNAADAERRARREPDGS